MSNILVLGSRQKGMTKLMQDLGYLEPDQQKGTEVCGGTLFHRNISEAMNGVDMPQMECILCGHILRTNDSTCKKLV